MYDPTAGVHGEHL